MSCAPSSPATQAVDAVLMASGLSTRFPGKNKLLLPFGGESLVRRTLLLFCGMGSQFGQVLLVCSSPEVARQAEGLPVTVVHNPAPQHGAGGSVRLGVLASTAAHYLFAPCDQPFLDEETILSILGKRAPGYIITPHFRCTPGSPSLFSATFRQELLALQPGQNAREIKKRHPEMVIPVALPSALPLADIDTREDYNTLLKALETGEK